MRTLILSLRAIPPGRAVLGGERQGMGLPDKAQQVTARQVFPPHESLTPKALTPKALTPEALPAKSRTGGTAAQGGGTEGAMPAPALPQGPSQGVARIARPLVFVDSPALPPGVLTCPRHGVPIVLPFAAITAGVFDRIDPLAVGLALFCPRVDATVVLERLLRIGYRGRILVLAPPLPDPRLVQRDLAALFPALRLRVLCEGAAGA